MRRFLFLCLLVLTASCGRPLTEAETGFIKSIQGDTAKLERVRVQRLFTVGAITRTYAVRPRTTCRELILPPPTRAVFQTNTAGLVAFNRILLNPDWYLEDYLEGWPEVLNLPAAMFMAHELTHVWQWQNRRMTGYHPLKAVAEHTPRADPYLFDADSNPRFLDYHYEQQASLVEEYVCCRALDPGGARTARLHELLAQVMDPEPLSLSRPAQTVLLPWDGARVEGICSQNGLEG